MSTCHRAVAASVLVLVSAMACDKAPTGANGAPGGTEGAAGQSPP